MSDEYSTVHFILNGTPVTVEVSRRLRLVDYLRSLSLFSVKYGCREGDCGMCTVLINGKPTLSCMTLVSENEGKTIQTLENLARTEKFSPIQQAFKETGAIQCGFCSPAHLLTIKALLDKNPDPTEDEIRYALKGIMCRCTGFVRIVEAAKRAAAYLQGKEVAPVEIKRLTLPEKIQEITIPEEYFRKDGNRNVLPPIIYSPQSMEKTISVGSSQVKVDAQKLVDGKGVFTDDFTLPNMLYAVLVTSPHAHARILNIDTSRAKAIQGVHTILTYKDIPRIKYASGGQSFPQPLPYDQVCLDNKVRHVGDRVAVVAAESQELAERAARMIKVDYEVLPCALTIEDAMKDGAPVIHDEKDTEGIHDPSHNIVHHIEAEVGNLETGFSDADFVYTGEYRTPKQQHAQMEVHTCISYWDEDDRMVLRSSTQVPFHVRRIVAPLVGIPIKNIRVIKPRIGGGFGGKQEILLEDLCAHLTKITNRPVKMEFSRRQVFTSSRTRHPQIIRYKVGIKNQIVTTMELKVLGDTGAYGSHGLTVQMVGGLKGLSLYNPPNARFICDVVYTNTTPAGAFRGYGTMQEYFALEVIMEEIADKLGLDVVEFKRKNWLKIGQPMHLATKLGEGREGFEQSLKTSALEECVQIGLKVTDYEKKRRNYSVQTDPNIRHGIGMSIMFHGSGVAGLDMASASLKMNDDGSFILLIGATDIGTGSDTILAQIAAEMLGIPLEDIIVYSSDTDFTPFDTGAYASSTTYISGGAVRKAALDIKKQIQDRAALMLDYKKPEGIILKDRKAFTPEGEFVTFEDIALNSIHQQDQRQIMAVASHMSVDSPPPTAAQFVETDVDIRTGEIFVKRLLMVVDSGRVINPRTAAGQVEGGMAQALGFSHSEETIYDSDGRIVNADLGNYHVYRANEMPVMDVIFVETDEPSGPYGAKSIAEISIDGVAPALVNAIHNATGIWIRDLPLTPEKVWRAINQVS